MQNTPDFDMVRNTPLKFQVYLILGLLGQQANSYEIFHTSKNTSAKFFNLMSSDDFKASIHLIISSVIISKIKKHIVKIL